MIRSSVSAGSRLAPFVVTVCIGLGVATPADATPAACQRAIAKAGVKYLQARTNALGKCEEAVIKGTSAGPCPDDKALTAVAKASTKLASAIDKGCGGDDNVCGGDLTDEDTPAALGWPATCPNFEHGPCTNAIGDCGDIATCLTCIGDTAVDVAIDLYDEELVLPSSGDLNKCQVAIGKASLAFMRAKAKALQKCWDGRLKESHANACVPPDVGDGKYLAAIAKAATKRTSAICKACGGDDQACGGGDDLTPAAIGFVSDCPSVTIPGGAACVHTITSLDDVVACVDCVTEFKVDCIDRVRLPLLTPYPSECGACAPFGSCPTRLTFTADGPAVDLDTGSSGYAHDSKVPTNGRLTLDVSGCAGTLQPSCGQCNVSGPVDNDGGDAFDNHRCANSPWNTCSTDGDCPTGTCVFFFGAPLPLAAGGVQTCVLNQIAAPISGTIDFGDGSSTTHVRLRSTVSTSGESLEHPCPVCENGVCNHGPRQTLPCKPQGSGVHGAVSLDCPPGGSDGILSIDLLLTTGTQTRTLSTANPPCSADPGSGKRCLCDTCNNANQEPCSTNADCPPSGGNPGICGGRRCAGGTNAGGPCSGASACPGGGNCSKPGQPTYPNPCVDDSLIPGDGSICQDIGNNEGVCPELPATQRCSINTYRTCLSNADCVCPGCAPGQICAPAPTLCFPLNGNDGETLSVSGSPDPTCGDDVATPTLSALFCVGPVTPPAVNIAGGLPGPGRVRIPGTAVVSH